MTPLVLTMVMPTTMSATVQVGFGSEEIMGTAGNAATSKVIQETLRYGTA